MKVAAAPAPKWYKAAITFASIAMASFGTMRRFLKTRLPIIESGYGSNFNRGSPGRSTQLQKGATTLITQSHRALFQ
jgi:hypothetical protein